MNAAMLNNTAAARNLCVHANGYFANEEVRFFAYFFSYFFGFFSFFEKISKGSPLQHVQ